MSTDSGNLETEVEVNNYNGNVYIFLSKEVREDYLKYLEKDRNLQLLIQSSKGKIELEYILFIHVLMMIKKSNLTN